MIISPSLSFQCTGYTVTEMLLCLSSSFTIVSLNKMEQMQKARRGNGRQCLQSTRPKEQVHPSLLPGLSPGLT